MTVEGITLTNKMTANIRSLQDDDESLKAATLGTFDRAISIIAEERCNATTEEMVDALRLISDLCAIKKIVASLYGE